LIQEFLQKEFSEENILFWEACEELGRVPPTDTDTLRQFIQEIYQRWVDRNHCGAQTFPSAAAACPAHSDLPNELDR